MNKIILLIVVLMLGGCTVYGSEIEAAKLACEKNGGIHWMKIAGSVKCADGAYFRGN